MKAASGSKAVKAPPFSTISLKVCCMCVSILRAHQKKLLVLPDKHKRSIVIKHLRCKVSTQTPQNILSSHGLCPSRMLPFCWPTSFLPVQPAPAAPVVIWLFHPGLWRSANQRGPLLSHLLAPPSSMFFNAAWLIIRLAKYCFGNLFWKWRSEFSTYDFSFACNCFSRCNTFIFLKINHDFWCMCTCFAFTGLCIAFDYVLNLSLFTCTLI